jgi:hypothetical protein
VNVHPDAPLGSPLTLGPGEIYTFEFDLDNDDLILGDALIPGPVPGTFDVENRHIGSLNPKDVICEAYLTLFTIDNEEDIEVDIFSFEHAVISLQGNFAIG